MIFSSLLVVASVTRDWKESWDAYEKEKLRQKLDAAREEFGLFFWRSTLGLQRTAPTGLVRN